MKPGIKIAICDDEAVCRESMERMCRACFEEKKYSVGIPDIHVFSSGQEIITSDKEYDILLLDIEMPEQDGISIKEYLEANRKQTRIIFTTSHKERVLEAFGKNVVSFLVKPLVREEFQNVMEKVLSDICGLVLELEENGETFMIPAKQIKYIEAQDKYTLAVTETGEHLMRRTMKFWEEALPCQDFVRIHKSYLVNLEYFEKKGEEVRLDKGKSVKISRLRKNEIREKYKEFLRRKVKVM
ncbi:MAG: response regulator transcription factor [Lachnospiraceae bacterium]|nr:response regulator transcription factor [Lachnospiraceae bacterium]